MPRTVRSRALRTAQLRNARRWPATRSPSHASELRRLRAWLTERVVWIDANIAGLGAPFGQAAAERRRRRATRR